MMGPSQGGLCTVFAALGHKEARRGDIKKSKITEAERYSSVPFVSLCFKFSQKYVLFTIKIHGDFLFL